MYQFVLATKQESKANQLTLQDLESTTMIKYWHQTEGN
jgi:hypothetical protein